MKKYRVVNRFRFISFLTVCILMTVLVLTAVIGIDRVSGMDVKRYTTVQVKSGDTLWNIAAEYGPDNQDIRQTVYEICKYNNVSADTLMAGQYITVPEI